ncbi:quinolinate synthase A [Thermoclostridium stercorarium subsp. stercorarium DSM 8532]|jgi:quinolinate synthase|uniref:Quinolinate synthase n=3 Tax=Thermoclostridium stercorarium TaxID=1510 RepID=L7VSQ0_THES1|nr:quinolinate synthase NadA [Thermoclostridium stercorarium]AGC68573.1 quinolinate synthase A [Thermoclostridium stercorarium subsp. stercorarium DSM 8532]AGI39589.1 quinolinate synthetase [Thermoclostridium stercorarium subsp. stercorarium DSM 8532]ANW98922.1 quinolinate synthetase [Thermoclostridium stercorarium subsp. thermolacticum DSM 2910]ANX01450.1 quinolinate synthetase [Thermoclostridium stercorarium subsp. leptospartum DSM 9219]
MTENFAEMMEEIKKMKKERNAVIVAHNYQLDEVQELADVVGDSFRLSQYCASTDADVVVFCGVHFMAESAKILSPEKTVLLPEIDAGCPMADMVTPEALIEEKKKYPNATVVCYINTSAAVKAECDVCCTSSNAVNVIRSIPNDEILFVPDKNLGSYVAKQVPDKKIHLWDGYCITHHRVSASDVQKAKGIHPDALVLAHPECRQEVLELADFVGSTAQIIEYAKKSSHDKFLIATEMGILHQLRKDNPDKTFYLLTQGLVCPNMKKTTVESVYNALKHGRYEIKLDEDIIRRARRSLDAMLRVR